jgi:4-aminobutyrate aminotransferase / (S)-3-amino-2-methylpropionate transaminase / 5-aminovalerate transaminase
VLDAMERERIPERAARAGERIAGRFRSWAECYPAIGDVRGLGAMVGMELVADRATRAPDKALTSCLLGAALRRGVILLSAGTYGNVVRVLAPLTAEDSLLDEGLDAMGQALAEVAGGSRQPS